MKHIVSILASLGLAATAVVAEEEPDLDDPVVKAKVLATAVLRDDLGRRGSEKGHLFLAPNSQTLFTGWTKKVYDNGEVKLLAHFKEGKLHGPYFKWHDNGREAEKSTLREGELDGLSTLWNKNGKITYQLFHKNGDFEIEGVNLNDNKVLNDPEVVDQLSTAWDLSESKKDGLYTAWWRDGPKFSEKSFKDGKPDGVWRTWHPNGKKRQEETYKDGRHEGLYTEWSENGQKSKEHTSKDGKLEGLATTWWGNGQKWHESTSRDGKREGLSTMWHRNGQKHKESTYKNGKREGPATMWHDNGEKSWKGTYKNGKRDGPTTAWDKHGIVIPDFNDSEVLKAILAKAVLWESLERREAPDGPALYFVLKSQSPFTGWAKKPHSELIQKRYPYAKVELLAQFKDGKPDGVWSWWRGPRGELQQQTRYVNGVRVK